VISCSSSSFLHFVELPYLSFVMTTQKWGRHRETSDNHMITNRERTEEQKLSGNIKK
jgi:hypothetical protein